jgi:hypothetical protein
MVMRGRHNVSRWGSWIDGGQVILILRNEQMKTEQKQVKTNSNKQQKNKRQTKETETSKCRSGKQTRLTSAWTLFCECFRGLRARLLIKAGAEVLLR